MIPELRWRTGSCSHPATELNWVLRHTYNNVSDSSSDRKLQVYINMLVHVSVFPWQFIGTCMTDTVVYQRKNFIVHTVKVSLKRYYFINFTKEKKNKEKPLREQQWRDVFNIWQNRSLFSKQMFYSSRIARNSPSSSVLRGSTEVWSEAEPALVAGVTRRT